MMRMKKLSFKDIEIKLPERVFNFNSTKELKFENELIGQKRAFEAINFGLAIQEKGYNIFVVGPTGTGRRTSVKQILEKTAKKMPTPDDWIYVYNFDNPAEPWAINLKAGDGKKFKESMEKLVEEISTALSKAFESEDYSRIISEIEDEYTKKKRELWENLLAQAKELGYLVQITPTGIATIPLVDDKPITPETFATLPDDIKRDIEERGLQVKHFVEKAMQRSRKLDNELKEKLAEQDKYVALFAIGTLFEETVKPFLDNKRIVEYLEKVKNDVIENIRNILNEEKREAVFARYKVNLFVDNSNLEGAPVIEDMHPTYSNVFGKIEYIARMGMMFTDYTFIVPGSIHRANGGFLILDSIDVLKYPYVWDTLKKTLMAGVAKIENVEGRIGLSSFKSPRPEPIPINVKVIIIGNELTYYLLYNYDPDFRKLFKIKSEFDWEIPLNEENTKKYIQFITSIINKYSLLDFTSDACKEVVKFGLRLSKDKQKLSASFNKIESLLIESSQIARNKSKDLVDSSDVKEAIEKAEERVRLIQEKYDEMILRGDIMVETEGRKVGQINGLTVTELEDHSFGMPVKITAKTYLGKIGVLDIQREADLSGKIHRKAVLTLENFLGWKYAQKTPISLSASISFEQVYSYLEGDSASVAETLAVISAISEIPLKQSIAVTGSMNQHGEVQPVGGIPEKVEGFFRICKAKGLTGEHGVIIPAANAENLVLKDEVLEAIKEGKFHIWTINDIDEAIEIMTDKKAGKLSKNGNYTRGSVNYFVCKRLEKMHNLLEGKEEKKGKSRKKKPKTKK
jgi:lon-related putative ATP-dependent protease